MAYLIQHNHPEVGCVSWQNLNMQYNGTSYEIADGYTDAIYVYWELADPYTLKASNEFPELTAADALVLLNKNGTAMLVPGATVLDGALIVPGTILAEALSANSVTGEKILAGEIDTAHLAAGAITADVIAAEAVGAAAIAAGAIQADHLDADVITSDKIVAEAVTTAKIAAEAVTANKIAANAVTAATIQAGSITSNHIDVAGLDAGVITAGKLDAERIQVGAASTFADGYDPTEVAEDAKGYADDLMETLADGAYEGGTFIDGTRIVAPEIHAGKVLGLYGSFSDMLIGDPEGARMQIAPRKPLEPYLPISGWWDGWSGTIASGHSISDLQRPMYAFDGDTSTYWYHDVDDAGEEGTWIGMEYVTRLTKYCLKRIRVYSYWDDYTVSLQCSDGPFGGDITGWVTVDENLQLLGDQWVAIDVNENDIFAYAWRLRFGQESAAISEVEFYGVPYEPSFAGFNRNNERIYELSDDGLRIFNDRFFMDNNQAAVIIDQGSNSNGSYVGWSNGLQICWIPSITLTYVNTGRLETQWTYPIEFKSGSIPTCIANPNQLHPKYAARTAGTVVVCTASYCTVRALAPTGTFEESDTWNFQAVVIGWWK